MSLPLVKANVPLLVSERVSRKPAPPTVAAAMVVVPLPERGPPFQVKRVVTASDCVPLIWPPLRVRLATLTATSSVTTFPPLTVAVSPEPGTPAPPHVAALLQLPLVVLLNDAANSGAAAQSAASNTPNRMMALVMEPLRTASTRRAPLAAVEHHLRPEPVNYSGLA